MSFKHRSMSSSLSSSMSSSSPREIIGYNEDIMTEISLYFPVKSILRFRSVSKQWNSLLTHPQFVQRYFSRKSTNSFLFFKLSYCILSLHINGDNHNLDEVDIGYMKNSCQDDFNLRRSCNGLLLFESDNCRVRRRHDPIRRRFYVCNPFTKKCTELPVDDSKATTIATAQCVFSYLAFNPSQSPLYKVIFFWKDDYRSLYYHITVYSSETRSCRELAYTFYGRDIWLSSGAVLNGAIYWACNPSDRSISSFFYFDITQELIRAFPKPPYSSRDDYIMYFGECRGHLHLIFGQGDLRDGIQRVFDVYELKEDHSSWFAKYKIDLDTIAVDFPEIITKMMNCNSVRRYTYPNFLYISIEDEKDPTVVLSLGNHLLAYNFLDRTVKKLCNIQSRGGDKDGNRSIWWHETFHWVESLSCV